MDLFDLIGAGLFALFASCFTLYASDLIDADGGLVFDFYGKALERAASYLEKNGQSSEWLKPFGLCPVCFTTWLMLLLCVFWAWQASVAFFPCFVVFMGAHYFVYNKH